MKTSVLGSEIGGSKLKAFRVLTDGYGEGIVFSENRPKAMWTAVRSYCDAFNAQPIQALRLMTICRTDDYESTKIKRMLSNGTIKENFFYGEDYIHELKCL
jgi:hypothetical protein